MKMVINGKLCDSVSGATFDIINPANGQVIESVPKANAEDIEIAVTAAEAGQKIWAKVPVSERAKVLYRLRRKTHGYEFNEHHETSSKRSKKS